VLNTPTGHYQKALFTPYRYKTAEQETGTQGWIKKEHRNVTLLQEYCLFDINISPNLSTSANIRPCLDYVQLLLCLSAVHPLARFFFMVQ